MKKYESRFTKLKQSDKEKTNLIAKLVKEIKQDQIVTNSQEAKFQISDPFLA
ncbi:5415_t:CDS:1, partial [Gigaspora margarita]